MSKNVFVVRAFPGGGAASGEDYDILRESDDASLDSGTLDADGMVTYAPNGHPGPFRIEVTDTGPSTPVTRVISSKNSGSGGAYSLAEIPVALRAMAPGVIDGYLNELAVTDPDSGPNLAVATGAVLTGNGIIAVWGSSATHAVATSQDATNPKACYLVVETVGPGEATEGLAVLKDTCGSAAASPSLPSLTQTDALWQEPLATFILGNSASLNADDVTSVTDVRRFALKRNATLSAEARRTDTASAQSITSTSGENVTWASGSTSLTLVSGVVYDLYAETFLLLQAPSGQTISIAPFLNGTGNIATYIASATSSGYVGVRNVHSLGNVTGTGSALTNGVRAKVSGGTGTILTGTFLAWAVPRS